MKDIIKVLAERSDPITAFEAWTRLKQMTNAEVEPLVTGVRFSAQLTDGRTVTTKGATRMEALLEFLEAT